MPADILDQAVHHRQDLPVLLTPVKIVAPRGLAEDDPHASGPVPGGQISSCSAVFPSSISWIERSRTSAFRGLLSRCTVSCQPSNSSSDIITTAGLPCLVTTIGARLFTASSM